MPPAPALLLTRQDRRDLLVAAVLALVFSAGVFLPSIASCHLLGHAEDGCGGEGLVFLPRMLGRAAWIWCMVAGACLSQHWLPSNEAARPLALGLQVTGLTLLSPSLGALLGLSDGSLLPNSPYDLQVQASFAVVACLTFEYRQRRLRGEADAESLSHSAPAQARQLAQARMALLQAQVEPHFLFNTLAHLRRLAHTDTGAARAMLSDLRLYLAAALPELRQTETPLARELDLVRAFLALHQRRIGPDRLKLSFEIAPGLEAAIVPCTCLLTLAENAIKHGITPQLAGGEICVRALPDPELPSTLRLEVVDTGAGMTPGSGGGTGLVTLRARLAALHGSAARLSLHINQPQGLIARVQLPWH
ncbi:histidine kinase [Pelomonas sp. SE-A7]|uniref:sensor histidine kinase n=1 Tax=Pelomonas sp. SE-A7 TaxID=3054953 RepID=UPI00259CB995|nr:histidine kinase [Pelomonas sp. SE-A7]MDM4766489.1 histidine kinase [Pelomonas sp. SE-A7]